ncbi:MULTISPECIES: CcdB family protein [unclassified Mesorhizobium]|uniref:CcdB family protein n=1 Tax=unclassified Mesorhizobium TaxID=325217 RepID=UPI00112AEBB3|nr:MULTISPECIES: CcdB family protein [unclassified Mesorhizobium]TPJ67329.1 plasmid maintenance protein CcdB [Mesorhizobium sp. B2-6-1]TPK55712.1 plasmid maintenance protein CcdB [Mesorhizobium sp. B2-5-2]TPL16863.1 plasmid maintenance protein CcdB [Mesorhizobium sp. B2-4-10]TPL17893.1 plasmid maintenance protein CcdB [Mesorhizobium sp. B2-4-7]TPL31167.1 plasmid maintenance protein CcdB [Mesorhizobium sp. B2-4-9]
MARYDLYRNSDGNGYLLDVQSDLLERLSTRVVIPLMPPDIAPVPGRRLNPTFPIDGKDHVMVTQFMSALTASELLDAEGNLSRHHDDIVAAIDMLFQGF